jgi:plastocyanin
MIKFLGVAVAGFLVGLGGIAFAHDMAKMDMAAMDRVGPPPAATQTAATQTAAMAPNTIEINNFAFGPEALTVAAGTTVTWTNHDDEPHTVVNGDNPRLFKSGALDTDDKFTFTFDKPGTYKYFCSIHPHMTGTVVVK